MTAQQAARKRWLRAVERRKRRLGKIARPRCQQCGNPTSESGSCIRHGCILFGAARRTQRLVEMVHLEMELSK